MSLSINRGLNFYDSEPDETVAALAHAPLSTRGRRGTIESSVSHRTKQDLDPGIIDVAVHSGFHGYEGHDSAYSKDVEGQRYNDDDTVEEGEEVSLRQLALDLEHARSDVLRVNALILRAVWQCVLDCRPVSRLSITGVFSSKAQRSSFSVPLSVTERRAQLQSDQRLSAHSFRPASSSGSLRLASHSSTREVAAAACTPAGEGARQRRQHHSTLPSDHSLSTSGFVNPKPFIPPARYPELPSLRDSSEDYTRFNRSLYTAVAAASERGLLQGYYATAPLRNRQGQKGIEAALAAGRDGVATRPATGKPSLSLRASALSKVAASLASSNQGSLIAEASALHGQPAARLSSTSKELPQLESVSLLILRVAKERALAQFVLRYLRLCVYRRRKLLEEVELRHDYYIQRRLVRGWAAAAKAEARRRRRLLLVVLSVWRSAVETRKIRVHYVRAYCSGLASRARARAVMEAGRQRRYLELWRTAFERRRTHKSLCDRADAFGAISRARRPRYHNIFVSSSSSIFEREEGDRVGTAVVVVTCQLPRVALAKAFRYWKGRTERRLEMRLAAWVYERALMQRVLCQMRTLAPVPARHPPAPAPLDDKTVDVEPRRSVETVTAVPSAHSLGVSFLLPPAVLPPQVDAQVLSRQLRVHIDPSPLRLAPYKSTCARRVAQGCLLQRCFFIWRVRQQSRAADRIHLRTVRLRVMKCWLSRLARKQNEREIQRVVWDLWVVRWRRRQLNHIASMVYVRAGQSCVFLRWHLKASVQAGQRQLSAQKLRRLFGFWRLRSAEQSAFRASQCVADTIRETILLLGCVRRWRARTHQIRQSRLSTSVLETLRKEVTLRACFDRWRRRLTLETLPQVEGVRLA